MIDGLKFKKALMPVLFGMMCLGFFTNSAQANVRFCNHNPVRVYVSVVSPVGTGSNNPYTVAGWYSISAKSGNRVYCREILTGNFTGNRIYYYAEGRNNYGDLVVVYRGNRPFCIHPTNPFRHTNVSRACTQSQANAGYRTYGFRSFVPTAEWYTFNLYP